MNLWNKVLRLFYKPFCVGCGKAGEWLCNKCDLKMRVSLPECYVCRHISNDWKTHEQCKESKIPFNRFFIGWEYGKEARKLLAMYKYRGAYTISEFISVILVNRIESFIDKLLENYQRDEIIITTIPLHKNRENSRGFNQSLLIGEKISIEFGIRFESKLLMRKKDTVKQSKLSKEERIRNIKCAFRVGTQQISENIQVIILFDDVVTTGSTMNEAGLVLDKKYPDKEIIGVALFRGRKPVKRIN